MRRYVAFALAFAMGLSFVSNAEAKKPKPEPAATEETEAAPAEAEEAEVIVWEMKTVGVPDVDTVFEKAAAPIKSIVDARMKVDSLNTNLTTALGLPAGTPFADALADLKTKAEGKLTLAVDAQGVPKLSASDAVPANVQTALDAVNNGVSDLMGAVAALAEVPAQVQEVIAAAKGIGPSSFTGAGISPTQVPKMMKSVTGNVKLLGKAPGEVDALKTALTDVSKSLTSTFGG